MPALANKCYFAKETPSQHARLLGGYPKSPNHTHNIHTHRVHEIMPTPSEATVKSAPENSQSSQKATAEGNPASLGHEEESEVRIKITHPLTLVYTKSPSTLTFTHIHTQGARNHAYAERGDSQVGAREQPVVGEGNARGESGECRARRGGRGAHH